MIPSRWENAIEYGVLSVPLLCFAVLALVVGTVGSGRLRYRLMLVAGALAWPLPDRPFLGPVVLKLSYQHGVHLTDLVSAAALLLALLRPWRRAAPMQRD